MSVKELPPEISGLLKESHFAYFCTTDQENRVHITPMFFLFNGETNEIFVLSHSSSKKIKNIRTNPKVCLTVDVRDPENPFENSGVMVQGTASIEKTVDQFSVSQDRKLMRVYKGFHEKYLVLNEAQSITQVKYQEFTEVLVRVKAKRMVFWKGPNFVTVNLNRK